MSFILIQHNTRGEVIALSQLESEEDAAVLGARWVESGPVSLYAPLGPGQREIMRLWQLGTP